MPRPDRDELLERRVLDEDDRTVGRLAAAAVHGFAQLRLVGAGRLRQHVQRLIEILGLLADQRDVEAVLVLDQDPAVAIEQHAARRRQRQPPQVVVLGHLAELFVLRDLEDPEPDRRAPQSTRVDEYCRTVSRSVRLRRSSGIKGSGGHGSIPSANR